MGFLQFIAGESEVVMAARLGTTTAACKYGCCYCCEHRIFQKVEKIVILKCRVNLVTTKNSIFLYHFLSSHTKVYCFLLLLKQREKTEN